MSGQKNSELRTTGADLHGQLAGEYRILRKLGAGGFGTVFEAEHPLLKRRAAVKVLHASPGVDSVAVQRFIAEARSASQIRHRHIVDIFSFGTLPNGQYFYVMDLLEGAPLDRYLREHGKLAPNFALALLRPIANAIDALHAASLVHRDLKPANIYLAWDSNHDVIPKLLDFGLVKLVGDVSLNTATGAPLGTPYYMSPEQCQGQKVDGRADIYSLGVICFEILTGKLPFSGDSATAVLLAHVLQSPPPMSERDPELPSDLDEPVMRMLAKDPAARPETAAAAIDALELAASRAGLALGADLRSLPRPTAPPEEPTGIERDATVAQSGTRTGSASQSAGPRPTRWLWVGLGPLVILAWFIGETYEPSGAADPAEPAPSVQVEPAAATQLEPAQPAALNPAEPSPPSAATAPQPTGADAPALPAARPPVAIRVRGAPAGAEVWLGDQKLGPAEREVLVPFGEEPVQLTVTVAGRPPRSLRVTPNAPADVTLPADKPRPASKRTALPRDLENPF
jgi:eukaryotic-like serine/threonine-protein kinase